MKIGLLTFHNAINYGAALQAYASQKAINQMGFDCEVINYVNPTRRDAYNMVAHANSSFKQKKIIMAAKYLIGSVFMEQRRKKFNKFYKENLKTTQKLYTTSEEIEELNSVYDKFIVGSDQVWNHKNNGADFSYFLNFVHSNEKKISYSSSFGLAQVPDEYKNKYIDYLNDIKFLSTREQYGVDLIKDLTGRNADLVLDPVFLLKKKEWLELMSVKAPKKPYVFSYTNRAGQWEEFINKTGYSMDGKSVHKISRHITPKDFLDKDVEVSYSISPNEFISQVAHAELVVSASFHCISLAIILNIPFVAILTGDKGKDERVLNILRITGLENRIFTSKMNFTDIDNEIDFISAENEISKYIDKSVSFLEKAILD